MKRKMDSHSHASNKWSNEELPGKQAGGQAGKKLILRAANAHARLLVRNTIPKSFSFTICDVFLTLKRIFLLLGMDAMK